jgi:hypothetical protein
LLLLLLPLMRGCISAATARWLPKAAAEQCCWPGLPALLLLVLLAAWKG